MQYIKEKNETIYWPLIYMVVILLMSFANNMVFIVSTFILVFIYSIIVFKKGIIKKSTLVSITLLYCFFVWAIFSTFNTTNVVENNLTVIMVFLPSIFLVIYLLEKVEVNNLYYVINLGLLYIGIIISLYGLLIWGFGSSLIIDDKHYQVINIGPIQLKQLIFGMEPFYRISSITSNPNSLALWLELSITSTFYVYYINKKNHSFIFFIMLIVQLGALVLTFSRTGYIISFLVIILWISIFNKRSMKKYFFVFVMIIFILGMIILYFKNYNSLNQRFLLDLNDRDFMWSLAIKEIINNPIKGVGFAESTNHLFLKYGTEIGIHNGFLTLALEMGILPVMVLIFIWMLVIINLYKLYSKIADKNKKITIASLLVYLIVFIPQQLVEAKIFRFDIIHFIWLYILTFSIVYMNNIKEIKERSNA